MSLDDTKTTTSPQFDQEPSSITAPTPEPVSNGASGNSGFPHSFNRNNMPMPGAGPSSESLAAGGTDSNSASGRNGQFSHRSALQQQAQAAHAAAAMAEKRLAMTNARGGTADRRKGPNNWPNAFGPNALLDSQAATDFMNQNGGVADAPGAPNLAFPPYSNMMYPQMLMGQQAAFNQQSFLGQAPALQGGLSSLGQQGIIGGAGPSSLGQVQSSSASSLASASKLSNGYAGIPSVTSIKKKKIKGKPKRPLSAYNLFFKHERARILESLKDPVKEEDEGEDEPGSSVTNEDEKKKKGGSSTSSDKKEDSDKEKSDDDSESKKKNTKKKTPHGKIGFENLAKCIGQRWSQLEKNELEKFKKMALEDMKRYKDEMEVFLTKQQEIQEKERKSAQHLVHLNPDEDQESQDAKFGKRKFDELGGDDPSTQGKFDDDQFSNPLQRQQMHVQQLQQQLQQQQQQQLQHLLQQQQAFLEINAQKSKQDVSLGGGMADQGLLYAQSLGGMGMPRGGAEENSMDQNLLAKLVAQQNSGLGLNNMGMQGLRGMGGANMGLGLNAQSNGSQASGSAEEISGSQPGQGGNAQQTPSSLGHYPWVGSAGHS